MFSQQHFEVGNINLTRRSGNEFSEKLSNFLNIAMTNGKAIILTQRHYILSVSTGQVRKGDCEKTLKS